MDTPKKSKGGRPNKAKQAVGQKFGLLTVVRFSHMAVCGAGGGQSMVVCQCDCGSGEKVLQFRFLKTSKNLNCGCVPWVNPRRVTKEHREAMEKKWRVANRDRLRLKDREWAKLRALKNPGKLRWAQKNPEKARAIAKRFRENHPDRLKQWRGVYRARKLGAQVGDAKAISKWEKKWRKKRAVRCYWCGVSVSPKKCHIDHVIALILGGVHSLDNVCIACEPCNLRKNKLAVEEWNRRLDQPVLF